MDLNAVQTSNQLWTRLSQFSVYLIFQVRSKYREGKLQKKHYFFKERNERANW